MDRARIRDGEVAISDSATVKQQFHSYDFEEPSYRR